MSYIVELDQEQFEIQVSTVVAVLYTYFVSPVKSNKISHHLCKSPLNRGKSKKKVASLILERA
jgi:hypothetical protein